jgi:hypothetical protein
MLTAQAAHDYRRITTAFRQAKFKPLQTKIQTARPPRAGPTRPTPKSAGSHPAASLAKFRKEGEKSVRCVLPL